MRTPGASPAQAEQEPPVFLSDTGGFQIGSGAITQRAPGRPAVTTALPDGVDGTKLLGASVSQRGMHVIVPDSRGMKVFSTSAGAKEWVASTTLTPQWPDGSYSSAGPIPSGEVTVTDGPGVTVVIAQLSGGMTTSFPRVFVSTDGGATFAQRVYPDQSIMNAQWLGRAFSDKNGVVVTGRGLQHVDYTSDAAVSWSRPTIQWKRESDDRIEYAGPVIDQQKVYLPARSCSPQARTCAFALLVSRDGGATFSPEPSTVFDQGFDDSAATAIKAGYVAGSLWLIDADHGLRTWSAARGWVEVSKQVPEGISGFAPHDQTTASILVSQDHCTGEKTGCTTTTQLLQTVDGGKTWISP